MNKILDYLGKQIIVDHLIDGEVVGNIQGTLSYYDLDRGSVHISEYTSQTLDLITEGAMHIEQGALIVLNPAAWSTLRVRGN